MKKVEIACIIDDDQVYVFGLKKLIEFSNFCKNVMVFANGEEALKYLKPIVSNIEELPDVIILDINMPIMDGWGFLDEFIKIKHTMAKNITIYMVSSSIQQSDIDKAKGYSEVSDYIVKPVKLDDLKRIMQ